MKKSKGKKVFLKDTTTSEDEEVTKTNTKKETPEQPVIPDSIRYIYIFYFFKFFREIKYIFF